MVYKWYPGCVLVECECGKTLALTCLLTTCSECGADHERMVWEELDGHCSEDGTLHPWRYANRKGVEGFGFPYKEVFMKELKELSDQALWRQGSFIGPPALFVAKYFSFTQHSYKTRL